MPGGDRTGPMGMGPMTGRAAGYCAGYPTPGYMNAFGGRGFGGGGGRGGGRGGWGRRNQFYATGLTGWQRAAAGAAVGVAAVAQPSTKQELDMLRQQAAVMQQNMQQLQERIRQLETEASGQGG